MVEEFGKDQDEKMEVRKIVEEEQKRMKFYFEKQKAETKKMEMLLLLKEKMNSKRL